MSNIKRKPKKDSMIAIINKYSNNHLAYVQYFLILNSLLVFIAISADVHIIITIEKNLFECTKCRHQHYLFAGTIFQDNKLPLFKLILGLYLFFSANKGCTAIEMASELDIKL